MIKQYQEKPLRDLTFAIVGLGLIGGSYAKALRNLKVRKILGMDISHGIARACLNANMIDEVIEADGSNLKEADVIICSVYPEAIVGFVRQNVQNFAEGMLMTDATGVKGTSRMIFRHCCRKAVSLYPVIPWRGGRAAAWACRMPPSLTIPIILSCLRKRIHRKQSIGWKSLQKLLAVPVR